MAKLQQRWTSAVWSHTAVAVAEGALAIAKYVTASSRANIARLDDPYPDDIRRFLNAVSGRP